MGLFYRGELVSILLGNDSLEPRVLWIVITLLIIHRWNIRLVNEWKYLSDTLLSSESAFEIESSTVGSRGNGKFHGGGLGDLGDSGAIAAVCFP